MLHEYSHTGPKQVTIVCPGFATDCLETLEEINMQNREMYPRTGRRGIRLRALPEFERGPRGGLTEVVLQHAQGWPELTETAPDEAQLASARDRALALGAAH